MANVKVNIYSMCVYNIGNNKTQGLGLGLVSHFNE